ncbi:MAG: RNA ligase (ATP) [Planctomycetaceae bacterium]|jgi:RNA ligase (TIGR02306 family)|nr:RNA ligase (ATP) [Planctomycetaceae bacterium]
MFRKLATITKIRKISPIEGADFIEAVTMTTNGWVCVAKKGDFEVGEFGVYFEIDSFLPKEERYVFLDGKSNKTLNGVEGYRLRTIKLKKQISQGLLLPLSTFPEIVDPQEGDDVTELLNIKLYEPPETHASTSTRGCTAGKFPSFIRKTDQERIQSFEEERIKSFECVNFEITEKLDGTSCTIYYKDGHFGVCSRNLELKTSFNKNFFQRCVEWFRKRFLWRRFEKQFGFPKSTYEEMAVKHNLNETLTEYCKTNNRNLAIQGEIVGTGISSNRLKLNYVDFFVFDIFDIDKQAYIDFSERAYITDRLGLSHVPVIDVACHFEKKPLQEMIEFADGQSKLSDEPREGLVYKSRVDHYNESHGFKEQVSFKIISNKYLLKHGL